MCIILLYNAFRNIYIYLYILSPLLGDKCVYREHIKIPEQWGNLLGYVAFTGSKWGSLGDLPALAMATINCFKKNAFGYLVPIITVSSFFCMGHLDLIQNGDISTQPTAP